MDIFSRHSRNAKKIIIAGAVLFLLGAALLAYSLNVLYNSKPEKLTDISKGTFVYADVIDLAGPYATNEDNGNGYYYAMDEDSYVFILEANKATRRTYDELLSSAEKWAEASPLRIEGWIRSSAKELQPMTLDNYADLLPGRPLPSRDDPFVTKLVSTAAKSQLYLVLSVAGGTAMFIGLLLFLVGGSMGRRVVKARQRIAEAYPGYDDFRFLEERKTFEIPELKLFVKDHFLYTQTYGLNVVDLREASWMFVRIVRNRSSRLASLNVYLNTQGKKNRGAYPLTANIKLAEQNIERLWKFIEENYPSILIGDTKANKELYKSRLSSAR